MNTLPSNTRELFDLSGKTALVTGSSQGIGYTLAEGLARAGANIVLNGRDEKKLAGAAKELSSIDGVSVHTLPFDVTDHAACAKAVDEFEASNGAIDVLVNNAGMQHRTPLEDFDPVMFDKLLQTNVASVFHVGQAVARHMIKRGAGKMINIASIQTSLARPGIAPYTATKGAVASYRQRGQVLLTATPCLLMVGCPLVCKFGNTNLLT